MSKYQEALDYIVSNSCPSGVSCSDCNINNICNNLVKDKINKIQELIDRQEKYKWHDLKKDPNDLPKNDSRVLVELGRVCRSGKFIDGFFLDNFQAGKDVDAIAWRYLDRFDGE